jgi:type IV pilus assembly protein PilC
MPKFAYQARDQQGQRVAGTRDAADQRAALESLRADGFFVTKLAAIGENRAVEAPLFAPEPAEAPRREMPPREMPVAPPVQAPPRIEVPREVPTAEVPTAPPNLRQPMAASSPVPTQPFLIADAKQMSLYFRQMHAMIHAGSSVAQALNLMAKNAPNAALRRASGEMSRRTAGGEEWNVTMRAYPGLFSELMIGMITAGEHGGFLDRMVARLADYSERDYQLQQTVKRETWYPKILLACSFLIPSVVPLVLGGFPAWWQSMRGVIFFAALLFIGWLAMKKLAPGALSHGPQRVMIDEFKLRFPYAGKFVRALAAAKFCRALGALQSAGMGLHKTVMLSADACGNEAMARGARRIIHRLDKGETLTQALAETGVFPPLALQMLSTGEASGNIETQLDKVADFLEADAETAIKQAVTMLGVVVFLLVAIKIGMQVVQFYGGYFGGIEKAASDLSQ